MGPQPFDAPFKNLPPTEQAQLRQRLQSIRSGTGKDANADR